MDLTRCLSIDTFLATCLAALHKTTVCLVAKERVLRLLSSSQLGKLFNHDLLHIGLADQCPWVCTTAA